MSGILLETNVLSELMRPKPALEVLDWFGRQQGAVYFASAVTRAEILLGIALLPAGKRRNGKDFRGIAGLAVVNPWE